MHLTVKILNGEECTIAASPCSLVSDVKEQVEALMAIPVSEQKLVFKGRALSDTKYLRDYGVEDCCRLTLMVKKTSSTTSSPSSPAVKLSTVASPGPKTTSGTSSQPESPVWERLRTFLKRHFREPDVEAVLQEFKKEFERNLSSLSLDDIERMAITKLRQA